jgi:hypothetical protein
MGDHGTGCAALAAPPNRRGPAGNARGLPERWRPYRLSFLRCQRARRWAPWRRRPRRPFALVKGHREGHAVFPHVVGHAPFDADAHGQEGHPAAEPPVVLLHTGELPLAVGSPGGPEHQVQGPGTPQVGVVGYFPSIEGNEVEVGRHVSDLNGGSPRRPGEKSKEKKRKQARKGGPAGEITDEPAHGHIHLPCQ